MIRRKPIMAGLQVALLARESGTIPVCALDSPQLAV